MTNQPDFTSALSAANLAGCVTLTGSSTSTDGIDAHGCKDLASESPMQADTLFQIASMTKAIASVAALQCVEQGLLALDEPLSGILPALGALQAVDGRDAGGKPRFRAPKRPITLRHLLTHTSGLGYLFSNAELAGLFDAETMPAPGSLESISLPLLFDPGERWEYGVSTDWVGLAVEAVTGQSLDSYVASAITEPHGMADSCFFPTEAQRLRCATLYGRGAGDSLKPMNMEIGGGRAAAFVSGGGGMWSTASDYARFIQMVLQGGTLGETRILGPESVSLLTSNQIGALNAGKMGSVMSQLALPYEAFPRMTCGWSLAFLINPETGANGRAANSLAWAGIANCYYWIDPTSDRFGIFLTQLLPFADPRALDAFGAFERAAYEKINAA